MLPGLQTRAKEERNQHSQVQHLTQAGPQKIQCSKGRHKLGGFRGFMLYICPSSAIFAGGAPTSLDMQGARQWYSGWKHPGAAGKGEQKEG